jgi:hypothetical protein
LGEQIKEDETAGHVELMGEMTNAYEIVAGNREGRIILKSMSMRM